MENRPMRNVENNMRGFTLIELLVVISLIGLLVALLMPTLAAARTTSQLSVSLANERQITTAVLVYAEDSLSSVPFSLTGRNPSTTPETSVDLLSSSIPPTWAWNIFNRGYIAAVEVYWSPARELKGLDFSSLRSSGTSAQSYWYYPGYAANSEVMTMIAEAGKWGSPYWVANGNPSGTGPYPNGKWPTKVNDAKTPPPDKLLLLCDAYNNSTSWQYGMSGFYKMTPQNKNPGFKNFMLFNYNGAVPVSYLDGHAVADNGKGIGWNPYKAPVLSGAASNYVLRGGPYWGDWTYNSQVDTTNTGPWYTDYRRYR